MRKILLLILVIGGSVFINMGVTLQIISSQIEREEELINQVSELEKENTQLKRDLHYQEKEAKYWYYYNVDDGC